MSARVLLIYVDSCWRMRGQTRSRRWINRRLGRADVIIHTLLPAQSVDARHVEESAVPIEVDAPEVSSTAEEVADCLCWARCGATACIRLVGGFNCFAMTERYCRRLRETFCYSQWYTYLKTLPLRRPSCWEEYAPLNKPCFSGGMGGR